MLRDHRARGAWLDLEEVGDLGDDRGGTTMGPRNRRNSVVQASWCLSLALSIAGPITPARIEHDRLVTRGELRYRHDRWEPSEPYDWARREDFRDRILKEVTLPERVRELPLAGDVLPRAYAEIDRNKFAAYSLNPDHPQNNGKAEGWRALGFRLDTQEDRIETAVELCEMTRLLLPTGRVAATTSSPYGDRYKVLTGYIGRTGHTGT